MILLLVLYILSASTYILGVKALEFSGPFFYIAVRMSVGGALLLAYVWLRNRSAFQIKREDAWLFATMVFFHIYLSFNAEFWSLQYLSPAKGCMIYSLVPFLSALLSYVWFGETITFKKFLGLKIGILGFLPLILEMPSAKEVIGGGIGPFSFPELSMFLSAAAVALGWVTMRRLVSHGHSVTFTNGIAMLFGGLLSYPTSFVFEGMSPLPVSNWSHFILWTALSIVIANAIVFNLYGELLKKYTATFMAFAASVTPFFVAIMEWAVFGTVPTIGFWLTFAIVSAGLFLFYQEELRQGYIQQ